MYRQQQQEHYLVQLEEEPDNWEYDSPYWRNRQTASEESPLIPVPLTRPLRYFHQPIPTPERVVRCVPPRTQSTLRQPPPAPQLTMGYVRRQAPAAPSIRDLPQRPLPPPPVLRRIQSTASSSVATRSDDEKYKEFKASMTIPEKIKEIADRFVKAEFLSNKNYKDLIGYVQHRWDMSNSIQDKDITFPTRLNVQKQILAVVSKSSTTRPVSNSIDCFSVSTPTPPLSIGWLDGEETIPCPSPSSSSSHERLTASIYDRKKFLCQNCGRRYFKQGPRDSHQLNWSERSTIPWDFSFKQSNLDNSSKRKTKRTLSVNLESTNNEEEVVVLDDNVNSCKKKRTIDIGMFVDDIPSLDAFNIIEGKTFLKN